MFVRLDPIRMDKVYAFSAETGVFLDVCLCPELADVNRTDFVQRRRPNYQAMVSEREKKIRADVRELQKGPSGIERTIRLAKRKRPSGPLPRIRTSCFLPHREEQHVTPQIAAALDAATHEERRKPAPLTGRAAEVHAQLKAELSARRRRTDRQRHPHQGDAAHPLPRALDLQARAEAGEAIPTEDAIWLGGYLQTIEFHSERWSTTSLAEPSVGNGQQAPRKKAPA